MAVRLPARSSRARLLAFAVSAILVGSPGFAAASGPPGSAEVEALRREVEALSALVRSQHAADEARIAALSSTVESLKGELAARDAQGRSPEVPTPASVRVLAAEEPERAEPRVVQNVAHKVQMQSADGAFQIGFAGLIQLDAGAYDFRPRSATVGAQYLSNGFNARRARIGVAGKAGEDFAFSLIYDGGNSQDTTARGIQSAQIIYSGIKGFALEAGYGSTYFTLDQSTGAGDVLFMERASSSNVVTNINTGDFRSAAGFRLFSDRYWIGAYMTGPSSSSDSHTQTRERFGYFGRATVQAVAGRDYSLHLGLGYDVLAEASDTGPGTARALVLSDQPNLRIDATQLLNSGTLGTLQHPVDGASVVDFEAALTRGPLYGQAEYFLITLSRSGLADNDFKGGYAELAYALTGETRPYSLQSGAYARLSPRHPLQPARGWYGAFELAARYDEIDLVSRYAANQPISAQPGAVNGGVQKAISLGLNWYPNDIIRVVADYNHVQLDKQSNGLPVGARFDAVALRLQATY
jgi:phosphate-selective porin OprO/OprP